MRILLGPSLLVLWIAGASAQVVEPAEIYDPSLRTLQQSAMPQLKLVAKNISTHKFDYNFYFTRKLDIDEKKQKSVDQHSIRFEHYNDITVLAISGNYFGAYPASKFNEAQRARKTFFSVVLPLAKAVVPVLENDADVQGFAFEISHHVIGKAMGMPMERPENLMVYLPRAAAIKLVTAKDRSVQQAALLAAQVFLNAAPLDLWLSDEQAPSQNELESSQPVTLRQASLESETSNRVPSEPLPDAPGMATGGPAQPAKVPPAPVAAVVPSVPSVPPSSPEAAKPLVAEAPRAISPQAIASLQSANQAINNHLVKELAAQAHFIPYAPPAFIAFRNQSYLELSLSATLGESAGTSRYKLAALTFDEQTSPLVRRVLAYFPEQAGFDGISFSYTVHNHAKPGVHPPETLSIEFFFSLKAMRRYESFDLTGQELLNSGVVLINGERVGVDLQVVEGNGRL